MALSPPGVWVLRLLEGTFPRFRSDSLRMQIAALAEGVGVGLIPEGSVAHDGLVRVPIGSKLKKQASTWPASELFLVMHEAVRHVPRVRWVANLLTERLRRA